MAARENQGIQIALIIFVILTIILTVTTYMFFSSYQKVVASETSARDKETKAVEAARKALEETLMMKMMIGAAENDDVKSSVMANKDKDMQKYGKGIPDANKNYRFLVEQMWTQLQTANTQVVELTTQKKDLDAKLKANDEAKKAEIAKYSESFAAADKDRNDEREKFDSDRSKITNEKTELAKKFDAKRSEHEQLTKQTSDQIAELKNDKGKLRTTLQRMNEEKERDKKANEVPDGKVTWINQVSRTVWINLGSDDGLRRQISFSVFDKEDTNPVESDRKGKIEVVRLKDRHLAEARIVDDDLSNPIMPGDQIFSPTWEPGRPEHFALAGFMDIDDDGLSDRQRIHDLISLNGGVIDAEASDDGKKTGNLSINTKYLILGEEPKETQEEGKINAYSEIFDEAKTYGVKTMPIHEFLNHMGYKAEDRSVNLGAKANSNEFKPRMPEGVQRVVPGNVRAKDLRKPAAASGRASEN
jgi:uncharacterized protein (UPF0333 family)